MIVNVFVCHIASLVLVSVQLINMQLSVYYIEHTLMVLDLSVNTT